MSKLRPLTEQVIVMTGASSGIGRLTARRFAEHGASVVLAARQQQALEEAAHEVEQAGGLAEVVVTDVADWDQVERLAARAAERFGHIDTWVNNAGVNVVGRFEDLKMNEVQRVLQVNLMGQIHGTKAALPYLIEQGRGSIINIAAAAAKRSVPLQLPYSMAMHGIKGFTEGLRLELAMEHPGINVSLVMPGSVYTQFLRNARSKLGREVLPIGPIFTPDTVAEVVLACATKHRRDIFVGVRGELFEILDALDPSVLDWHTKRKQRGIRQQYSGRFDSGEDNLFTPLPVDRYRITGQWSDEAKSSTLYSRFLQLHPNVERLISGTLLAGVLVGSHLLARRTGK